MIGERGGSTATLEEAEELLEARKANWSATIRLSILESLEIHGRFHASDLLTLGIPADCKNCVGAQVMAVVRQGLMEETGQRISSPDPAGHGRRSAVYRITEAGSNKLRHADQGCRGEGARGEPDAGLGASETVPRVSSRGQGVVPQTAPDQRAAANSGKGCGVPGSGGSRAVTATPTLFELEADRPNNHYEGEAA